MLLGLRKFLLRLWPIALCFTFPALLNGSPFYDYDSGDYIYTGLRLSASLSRPIFYGLFILFTSGTLILMGTVVTQSFLLAWSLEKFLSLFNLHHRKNLLGIAILWSVLSPVARISSQVMPDVFCTAFILLLAVWVIRPEQLSRPALWIMALMGMSHNALLPLFALGAILLSLRLGNIRQSLIYVRGLAIPALTLLMVLLAANWGKVQRFTLSPAASAFQTAKYVHSGALQAYLQQNCPDGDEPLCGLKDSIPKDFNAFLWAPNSAMERLGGMKNGWKNLNALNKRIRRCPEAMEIHLEKVIDDFLYLCVHHNWIVGVYVPGTNTEKILNLLLPRHRIAAEKNLWQNFFPTHIFNPIFGIALILGSISCVLIVFVRQLGPARFTGLIFLLCMIVHHALVALYSIPDNRLTARVSILLILPLFILVFRYFSWKGKSASSVNQPPSPLP